MCILCDMAKAAGGSSNGPEAFSNKLAARDALQKFIDTPKPELKVGDTVERNEFGEGRYHVPRNNQAAVVTALYDAPRLDQSGVYCDIEVTLAMAVNTFVAIPVDSRYFKLSTQKDSNVVNFGRRL